MTTTTLPIVLLDVGKEIFLNVILPASIGVLAYIVTKRIDENSKVKEEIREIQRKRYEEFIDEMESALQKSLESVRDSSKQKENQKIIHSVLNKLTGKMFISAPDEVIKSINDSFHGTFNAEKRRPIYYEMRKKLLGKTNLTKEDLLWWSETGDFK